ncbi:DUF1904 domain-containing protein [Bdellovibrio sp. BCCA]|uniref:DUF1904 domain-containing protein n=1 Tax=Bdellovibrio sp. BCCA TaxID=3136281 RepID=UPI0030F12FE8
MPHIRMRAVKKDHVRQLSQNLAPELAQVMSTAEDNFTFECIATEFFFQGQATVSYPFVEVLWFARSQEVQDSSARIITDKVKALTGAEDVVVVFQVLEKSSYYENGQHF